MIANGLLYMVLLLCYIFLSLILIFAFKDNLKILKLYFIITFPIFLFMTIYLNNYDVYANIKSYVSPNKEFIIRYDDINISLNLPSNSLKLFCTGDKYYYHSKRTPEQCINHFEKTLAKLKTDGKIKNYIFFEPNNQERTFEIYFYNKELFKIVIHSELYFESHDSLTTFYLEYVE